MTPESTPAPHVQLCRASLPFPLGILAVHYWFTLRLPNAPAYHRWEIWQSKNAGGTSWDHLHLNLKPPLDHVGGGPAIVEREFHGTDAHRLAHILTSSPTTYPHRLRYRPWPGPNSNTFVAWVLKQANILHPLSPKALGKNYRPPNSPPTPPPAQ